MNRMHRSQTRRARDRRRSRVMIAVLALVIFAGMFAQITMLSRISSQSKQASALEKEIVELSANAENLELSINQYHNLENIAARAQQLGMEQHNEAQIRVVNVARSENNKDTSIQAVEAINGEKVIN